MKIGFIGCGNMASAMMGGIVKNQICSPKEITVHDLMPAAVERVQGAYGVSAASSNQAVVEQSQIIVLAVKPHSRVMKSGRQRRVGSKCLLNSSDQILLSQSQQEFLHIHRIKGFHVNLADRKRELGSIDRHIQETS